MPVPFFVPRIRIMSGFAYRLPKSEYSFRIRNNLPNGNPERKKQGTGPSPMAVCGQAGKAIRMDGKHGAVMNTMQSRNLSDFSDSFFMIAVVS